MSGGVGIILCGGQARRLGGISKADIMIGTQSCFQRALACFDATFPVIAISGTSFSAPGYKSIPDWPSARRGGSAYAILGSLSWAALQGYEYMLTCPVDTPFLPQSYAAVMSAQFESQSRNPVVCESDDRIQGLHALWPTACLKRMKIQVLDNNILKLGDLHEVLGAEVFQFQDQTYDCFHNLNKPEDIVSAQKISTQFSL